MIKKVTRTGTVLAAALVLSAPAFAISETENAAVIANSSEVLRRGVPEIDAAGAMLAFSLMGGIVAIVRERRRRSR
ncbi:MAG: hypothetical protein PVF63_06190 [Gammaproteobacteria bacterium]